MSSEMHWRRKKKTGIDLGYCAIGLYGPKNEINVGGAMRAAACFGVSLVAVQTTRALRQQPTDVHQTWRTIPSIRCTDLFSLVPHSCVPVAIELIEGAQSLVDYVHPVRAFYIFGPEDGTLGRKVLERCRDIVQVPTAYCMNLAATVNVVLYDRLAKEGGKVCL